MKLTNAIIFTALLIGSFLFVPAQTLTSATDLSDTGKRGLNLKESDDGAAGFISSSSYAFSAQSGVALEDMSSGTTQLLAPASDNENSAIGQIGFVFRFDNGFYTTFGANANGLIKLGGLTSTTNSLNAINSSANAPKIMPYWDDLCVGSSGRVHYKTVGGANNRKLVIEWKNMKITRGTGCDGSGSGTFQLWLYDRTGVIQFVYGNGMGQASAANSGYSVGIQSDTAGNFSSITTATNSVSYDTANNGQTDAIAAGTSYLFTPNVPTAPTGGGSTATQTTATVNWVDNASNETGYLVRRTTDNVNFYFVGYPAPNSTTFNDTGLSPSTQYFYYINALSEGAFSDDQIIPVTTNAPQSISSTATGGNWNSPSTWANGIVPDITDNVTISSGSTVVIDTDAKAGNVTVGSAESLTGAKGAGPEGGAPARLTFEETAGHTLTVSGNVTIGSNDIFSTGGGNANAHILSISGNLINNGTLDFSTNNNQAGATINFTGDANTTFGGTGVVTDVFRITVSKGTPNSIVDLNVSNFTVQGSTTDTPASGYLYLGEGIFKISGTFTGNHRTFPAAAYVIPVTGGLWLNNPNYTIAAQAASVEFRGYLRVTAGTYNVGTLGTHNLQVTQSPSFIMEGGRINLTGAFGLDAISTTISGGTLTACMVGPAANCFMSVSPSHSGGAVIMSGGELVMQNAGNWNYSNATAADIANLTGTTLRFGNALTNGATAFYHSGPMPNVVIDTTAFPMSLSANELFTNHMHNLTIGPGAIYQFPSMYIHGTSLINNGLLKGTSGIGFIEFDDFTGLSDVAYSGTGTMTGLVRSIRIHCHSLTFDPAAGNLFAYDLKVTNAHVINAARMTLGRHDTIDTQVEMFDGATLDISPDFDLGPNGQRNYYRNVTTAGPEINSDRVLKVFSFTGPGVMTLTGGDLVATSLLLSGGGVIFTGGSTITTQVSLGAGPNGFVDGNLRMQFNSGHANNDFVFAVGQNGASPVTVRPTSIIGASALTIRAIDTTLPGLLPATSASRYWEVTEEGDITARLTFKYIDADIRGNENNYKIWLNNGGTPTMIVSTPNASANTVQTTSSTGILTGNWGIGEQTDPGPVSISGTITTSGGQPIRNAIVTISGGNLQSPIEFQTGNFGTYSFSGLQAGETYTVRVDAKRYRFSPNSQAVTPLGNVGNVNFAANPQD